ncbi:type I polyketide synthase [Aquitalea sp. USM4]|uniref:type I polyketide synthase n=1 Tax=Aquitalea sp. USM4 TaxID=1590041 RepID=UPI001A955543|nr:type I polyketide synthase [Aquitalea sp. USM4]
MDEMIQDDKLNTDERTSLTNAVDVEFSTRSNSPVAIVGYAFRFPGDLVDDAQFWEALKQKRDLVTQVPADRWAVNELQHDKRSEPGRSITFAAGVLSRIDEFDAGFFGISPREAAVLDPQQRLLLELAWESMEHAQIPPSALAGSDCAVYVGISGFDYGMRGLDDLAVMTSHSMTGNTLSIAANRISYVFDLHGPSLAVDTACSSSLVALHQACNSLRSGEVSTALVGGVNLLLHPHPFVGFTKASMLSADGRCKTFDDSGDGYVRSEGGAVLMLKPLDEALADGNEIHAVILASGVNADGARKTGITIPSSEGQAELMRAVLARSGLCADDVDFIEAHGTGTAIGDPIETEAISRVYGQGRTRALPISSVKANLGHLEPASGMAGLIKTILALKNRALPAAVHLEKPNARIDFKALNLELITEYKSLLPESDRPLVAGLNSFGFGGANAHVLLQGFAKTPANSSEYAAPFLPPLFLSAHSDAALQAMAQRYADLLQDKTAKQYYDIAHAAAFGRERLAKRLAIQPESIHAVAEQLGQYAQSETVNGINREDALPQCGELAFVYSGNGAQWVGMGQTLLENSPRFAAIMSDLDAAMRSQAGFSLLEELRAVADSARLDDTTVAQPLLFAIQVALTMMLREQGIKPFAVAGHSVGEIAAAWASGAFDLTQAIRVICARSQAQGLMRGRGRMAALGMSSEAADALIRQTGRLDVEIAGINSPGNVTLSGSLESLLFLQQAAETQGVFFRLLDLDYAFHSSQMDPVESELAGRLSGLQTSTACQSVFVSTVTGDVMDGNGLDQHYWWRNIREPVRFSAAIEKLAGLGCRVFVEIGPHAILQRYIGECLASIAIQGRVLPTLRRNDDGVARLQEAALRVQLQQTAPQLQSYFPVAGEYVCLPSYPWQRERHWMPWTSEGLRSIARRRVHPLLGWRLQDADLAWENTLDPVVLPWLADHKVGGAIVYPGSAYAEMALAAAREYWGGEHFVVEQLDIVAPMVFDGEHARSLRFTLNPRDHGFQIKSRQRLSDDEWTIHAAGRLLVAVDRLPSAGIHTPAESALTHDRESHYRLASGLGLDYGPAFRGLLSVRFGQNLLEAQVELPPALLQDEYLLHPAVLDLCFQSLVSFIGDAAGGMQGVALLPVKMGRIERYRQGDVAFFRAKLCKRGTRSVLVDFELFAASGELLAKAVGCRFRAAYLKRNSLQKVSNWRMQPWLAPHAQDDSFSHMALPDAVSSARRVLCRLADERLVWFKQTLPLSEVLVLSFAYEAFRQLAQRRPDDWFQAFRTRLATPHARWLADLLSSEGLLRQEAGAWHIESAADLPPAQELWQTLLRDTPDYLPHLALLGRAGRALPGLLDGSLDAAKLQEELQHSPVAEVLYGDDPAYVGVRHALEGVMASLAASKPASRRLRVLELAAGYSDLPNVLISVLAEDQFEYVLAQPDDSLFARQQGEYHDCHNVTVATFDTATLTLTANQTLPDRYDVIVLRHVLHRASDARAALTQFDQLLACGGVFVLAERHPDWCASLLEGLNPAWWHDSPDEGDAPHAALQPPEVWSQAMIEAGYADVETVIEPAAEELAEGAYLLLGRRSEASRLPSITLPSASWMLLSDASSAEMAERLCLELESAGQQVVIASEVNDMSGHVPDHIVHLLAWDDVVEHAAAAVSKLHELVRLLESVGSRTPQLSLVSCGGGLLDGLSDGPLPNPVQSALWGYARVVMNECPHLSCRVIDLHCDPAEPYMARRLANELLYSEGVNEVVLTSDARYCPMLTECEAASRVSVAPDARYRLDFHVPGKLSNLLWLPQDEQGLQEHQVEVETRATGLNFRDVMYLMGLLPDEAVEKGFAGASLGLEFSGVVTRVGSKVSTLSPGDAVMGFGASCFASHVVTRADALERIPQGWTFEAAATVPTVFLTVYYALKKLADLQAGERVLIHGAAGGVGIAAIQLARRLGAEVFATAGSDEKRDFVALLGADHVFDSRSLSFAEDVLAASSGEGVDVVLNSLAGEAMRRSLDVLKPFGRFLELGKRDFFENTPIGLRVFKDNISYFGIDADQLLTGRPAFAAQVFREVMALFHEQALTPLPYRSLPASHIVDAFRVMQQARHIGKIVVSQNGSRPDISLPPVPAATFRIEPDVSWLVSGGISGFGLESARWLAARGARSLVLVGRRGLDTPGASDALRSLQALGVKVSVRACDLTDRQAVAALVEEIQCTLPPLAGVLHAAAVFDDKLIGNLDVQSIQSVLNAKLLGAWHLHQATLSLTSLKHFVLYSSVTTAIGNPGQANYVAANTGLEGLVAMRRRMGLPAIAIAWGPIADAGYLNRHQAVKDGLEQRLGSAALTTTTALAQLDRALAENNALFIPANFDWNVLAQLLPGSSSNRFSILNLNRQDAGHGGESIDIRALIAGKSPAEAEVVIRDLVVQEVANILCIGADRIEHNRSLHDLGMDSLMAVELAMGLEQRFGIQLPVMMLNDSPTATNVTARIMEKLLAAEDSGSEDMAEVVAGLARQHGEGLSQDDMQQLNEDARKLAQSGASLIL